MSVSEKVNEKERRDLMTRKYWHSYHLQNLSTSRFIKAVGDIINKDNYLIPPNRVNKARA